MDIAIIGANGDVGRQLAVQIVAHQLLSPRSRLQLVGRRDGASHRALHGLRADLYDAFAEITEDRQFIHIDPVAAAQTPFGGTIAHGFLTLSLLGDALLASGALPTDAWATHMA